MFGKGKGSWGSDGGWGKGGGQDSMKEMMPMMAAFFAMMATKGGKGDWGKGAYGPMKSKFGAGGVGPYMPAFQNVTPATEEEVEAFLATAPVEAHAAEKLRMLDRKMAKVVIMKGSMEDARDATAVLIQRCSAMTQLREGDWICSNCYDHQFGKNDTCRRCGHPRGNSGTAMPDGTTPFDAIAPLSPAELEMWLAEYPTLEPRVVGKLKGMDPRMQRVIINKGPLHDARDPNAVIVQRCTAMLTLQPGDWICASCYDHQFGKNANCRRCGAPKSSSVPN